MCVYRTVDTADMIQVPLGNTKLKVENVFVLNENSRMCKESGNTVYLSLMTEGYRYTDKRQKSPWPKVHLKLQLIFLIN